MNQFIKAIEEAKTIAISGHVRPDGDCVGSSLAVYTYITNNYEKQVDIYLESIRPVFKFLKNTDKVVNNPEQPEERKKYDLFICCDCGDTGRLGAFDVYFKEAKKTICIDHHISNDGFGDIRFIDVLASSTCEIVYSLLETDKISKDTANALYTGIVHDTGVFKHSNTTKKTMTIAGELLEKGVDSSYIIDDTFYAKTYLQNQILGRALLESILTLDGQCIISYMKKDTLEFYGADSTDLDGIIDQLRITKGVKTAIFIYETTNGVYKVSMRANGNIDVSKIAKLFGGGGHIKASGCEMTGSIHDVINNLLVHIEDQIKAD